ncbi:sensor histidine kinase [Paenibacillus chartarius]|uniref:Sensor histidine kinase n=1 Tax=Paenibacillus chartarius TaxID=747481 RepID=A0ABV6DM16_9BACL
MQFNIFQKMILLLVSLLVPVMALYYYSTHRSVSVIQDELIKSSLNRMALFMAQLDASIEKLELVSTPILVDMNVLEYLYNLSLSDYPMLKTRLLIQEKLSLASNSGNWRNEVIVYFPKRGEGISSSPAYRFDRTEYENQFSLGWRFSEKLGIGSGFTRTYVTTGSSSIRPDELDLAVRINLFQWDFENLLDTYKASHSGDPFFFKTGYSLIANRSADEERMERIVTVLSGRIDGGESGYMIRWFDDKQYLITYYYSALLDWHLIDAVPLDQVVGPIKQQRVLFAVASVLLLITGVGAAFALYWNVQMPIFRLVRGVQRIKRGDYSYRLKKNSNNEFSFLMQNFNEMAAQIQDLIENVLQSQIHARDATLKQLQAQIHPHFLYNSLGFIINMTKMKNDRAVIDMAHHLSDYFRYTTRMDNRGVSLKEELAFVHTYLEIHRLRNESLAYSIELPEALERIRIPRLLIQPLVENALVHGLEHVDDIGRVQIRVVAREDRVHVEVEDNGSGMEAVSIAKLLTELRLPADDYAGCGLWNVYHRLQGHFGGDSEIAVQPSAIGGLKVELIWRMQNIVIKTEGSP